MIESLHIQLLKDLASRLRHDDLLTTFHFGEALPQAKHPLWQVANGWELHWKHPKAQGSWQLHSYKQFCINGIIETFPDGTTACLNAKTDEITLFSAKGVKIAQTTCSHFVDAAYRSLGNVSWRSTLYANSRGRSNPEQWLWPRQKSWDCAYLSLESEFPSLGQPGSLVPDLDVVKMRRTARNNPMTKAEYERLVEVHARFMPLVTSYSSPWQTVIIRATPTAIFQGNPSPEDENYFEMSCLEGLSFKNTVWPFGNFCGCIATEVDFEGATLSCATFTDACLRQANFCGADLRNVDFSRADLRGACFEGSQLDGADFENAILGSPDDFGTADTSLATFAGAQFQAA